MTNRNEGVFSYHKYLTLGLSLSKFASLKLLTKAETTLHRLDKSTVLKAFSISPDPRWIIKSGSLLWPFSFSLVLYILGGGRGGGGDHSAEA